MQFGAFPVFVVDGTPSPLKSRARIARFFRASGIEPSDLPVVDDGVSVERNGAFSKCVRDCVVGLLFHHHLINVVGVLVFDLLCFNLYCFNSPFECWGTKRRKQS